MTQAAESNGVNDAVAITLKNIARSANVALRLSMKPATLLYVSLSSDYFVSMFDQVYGWDRDFQVDWWGD